MNPAPPAVVHREAPASTPTPVPAVAKAPVPAPAPAPVKEPEAPTASSSAPVAEGELWQQFIDKVHAERPLVSGWVELGALLSTEGKTVKLGLPTTESAARDNLLRPATKKFLETILSDLLARSVAVEVVLDASLKPPPATEMSFGFGDFDAAPAAKSEPKAEAKSEAKEPEKPAGTAVEVNPEFYNDPLIQSALTKFKATLVTA